MTEKSLDARVEAALTTIDARLQALRPARPRGFAALSPAERHAIAVRGGRAAQRTGRAHSWDSVEAARAGRLGGRAPRHKKRSP